MDHIIQLKKIRAEALARMRNSDDFKLAGKLGQLIVELGDKVDSVAVLDDMTSAPLSPEPAKIVEAEILPAPTFKSAFLSPTEPQYSDLKGDEMIDELVAEIEGDAAKLDALMADGGVSNETDEVDESGEFEDADDLATTSETLDVTTHLTDAENAAKQGLSNLSAFIESEKLQQAQMTNGAAR